MQGVAGGSIMISQLGLHTSPNRLLSLGLFRLVFSLRLLFHLPFPSSIPILTQTTYPQSLSIFQKALPFLGPSELISAWRGGGGMSGDLGGGEGPDSSEAQGLALDHLRHWPPPCGSY